MAVKKHKITHGVEQALSALAQYIDQINEQPNYEPPLQEIIKHCQDIVKCLARISGDEAQMWDLLNTVEDYLMRIVSVVHSATRHEIIYGIMDKFFFLVSDPQSDACPAMSVVLIVLAGPDDDDAMWFARWLVQRGENGPAGAGLRASLSCLYRWVQNWNSTPALGHWLKVYIRALEENKHFDILIEVSLGNLPLLIMKLNNSNTLRQPVADAIFHILASLRYNADAFQKVAPHLSGLLVSLASDSNQWSRRLLQNLVDICTAMIDHIKTTLSSDALDTFKNEYSDVISCLERHMTTRSCRSLLMPPWKAPMAPPVATGSSSHVSTRKVGLLNLGNTCYMNSVMQALLATKSFSGHVVMMMNVVPYWQKLGVLFSKMMYSISTKLNPDDFLGVIRSPFFTNNNQHDSSEFLGYLLELLKKHEPSDDRLEPSYSGRSTSPRPGTSGLKRVQPDSESRLPPKKRMRFSDSMVWRNSFIDGMFGGSVLTRVECSECHATSLSRDVFRDLQLAFPEKPHGWKYSVQGLLEFYCSIESLNGDNRYHCVDCGGLRNAERSVIIESPPRYLILVLKNFKFQPKLRVQTKLMLTTFYNEMVTLPVIRSHDEHSTYILYAAIIHDGTTLDSGHYYTLAKENNQWFKYNDDVVTTTEADPLHNLNRSSTPYVLFYRRTDVDEGSMPSFDRLPTRFQEKVIAHNKHYVETVHKMQLTHP